MKENGELCGHSNRVFCVKFDPNDSNFLASGSWDNTIQIYDIRKRGPVAHMYGPHICGDAIDFKNDGHTLLTGSYRQNDVLELWDLRNFKKSRTYAWDGPKNYETSFSQMEEEKTSTMKTRSQTGQENKGYANPNMKVKRNPAAMIYSAKFNNETNVIMACGAGDNQVRLFDYDTGAIVCQISSLQKPILCMSKANTCNDFAFGSTDSKVRVIQQRDV